MALPKGHVVGDLKMGPQPTEHIVAHVNWKVMDRSIVGKNNLSGCRLEGLASSREGSDVDSLSETDEPSDKYSTIY